MDKTIQTYLKNSEKAEFLEFVNEHLPTSFRAIVLFEIRNPDNGISEYKGLQYGFNQDYEIDGFLAYARELYLDIPDDERIRE